MLEHLPNPLLSALTFIGFLLTGFPLPWHICSRNVGTSMYMLWTGLGCLFLFINSIVWSDNVTNWAPVWCDITAHYFVGASVGIPSSSLCAMRRLYYITKLKTAFIDKKQARREMIIDISIGIMFPIVVAALQYVVQNNRFLIFEQVGCYPQIANTPLAYFLVFMWPLCIGLIGFVYAALTFRLAYLQKEKLKQLLHAGLTISAGHYWRLMALCSTGMIFTIPLSIFVIVINATTSPKPGPYVSWDFEHSEVSQILQVPAAVWETQPGIPVGLLSFRLMYILCACVVFIFFGWAGEVREFYLLTFWSVCRRLGYSKPPSPVSIPLLISNDKRRFTYAGRPASAVYDSNREMRSKHLSLPIQARVKRGSLRTSISFEPPPSLESLSPSLELDVGTLSRISLPADGSVQTHMGSRASLPPMVPQPARVKTRG